MLKMKRIILPVDFSSACIEAVQTVETLAKHFSASVTLVHVIELPAISVPRIDDVLSAYAVEQQKRLDGLGLNELSGVPVERVVCFGDPAKKIIECADREDADLILMPRHGYGPIIRLLMGSTTAKVLDEAKCPVWTGVHSTQEQASGALQMRRVICGFCGSRSMRAFGWAAWFANKLGASLAAIYAFSKTPPSDVPERYAEEWEQDAPSGIESRIRGLARDANIEAEVFVSEGEAPSVLADAVKTRQAGLLVIGRSLRGVAAGGHGSDAFNIIRHAPCPVVSV